MHPYPYAPISLGYDIDIPMRPYAYAPISLGYDIDIPMRPYRYAPTLAASQPSSGGAAMARS